MKELNEKIVVETHNMINIMDQLNEMDMICKRYIESVNNDKLNESFSNIRQIIALKHYHNMDRICIFKN